MRIAILIVIILIALVAGFLTMQLASPSEEPEVVSTEPAIEAVNVLVARAPIPVGTAITDDMVDQQPWPKHLLLEGFVVSGDPAFNVVGMVVRSEMQQQEPFIKHKLANPNDANFIAAALPTGMRAITVSVDAISGVAGYIFPGDRVDISYVHNIPAALSPNRQSTGTPRFSETLLRDVTVLAVELQGEAEARRKRAAQNPEVPAEVAAPRNVTLAMSEADVQKIRLAEREGVLSLSLRSLKDRDAADSAQVTSLGDLTQAEMDAQVERDQSVMIIRGVSASSSVIPNMAMPYSTTTNQMR